MSDNPSARAARNEAFRRHKEEVRRARQQAYPWMFLFFVTFLGWAASEVNHRRSKPTPTKWMEGKAPALQPFYVVTQGYVNKKGAWCSFDNGENITVYHWLSEGQ